MGRPERDDFVDELSSLPSLCWVRDLNGFAHNQASHRMRDDVHWGFWLPGDCDREIAHEVDEADERLRVHLQAALVKIVVAEHPDALERILVRGNELERRAGIDEDSSSEEAGVQRFQRIGKRLGGNDRLRVVADDVGGIVVSPLRLHVAEDQPFVDVVLAPLLRIDGAVVETLIRDPPFVFGIQTTEPANQNQRNVSGSRHA